MARIDTHPTVIKVRSGRQGAAGEGQPVAGVLTTAELIELARAAGADDAGVVSLSRPELDDQRDDILRFAPWTRTLLALVGKMNREPIRSPARSVANLEFHEAGDHLNETAQRIVRLLEERGVRAINPAVGFPMEMDNFPGKTWVVSHKPVAVAAGLGQMGLHRNVIHPQFGNFILLATVLLDQEVAGVEGRPIDFNPCLSCKLCVAACPVGAISAEGEFNFSACYTHNYREFMGGFTDWVEQLADSSSRYAYRQKFTDAESASLWASLSFGANYKAAYCMSVCPAGEDVIGLFLEHRKRFLDDTLKPLIDKQEPVYVIRGSDAAVHVAKRFPHKQVRFVRGSLHPRSIDNFLRFMSVQFQPGQAEGLSAVYHFTFFGSESRAATVSIENGRLSVAEGHVGRANLRIVADSRTWLGFLSRERNLLWALLTRRIRLYGSPRWLLKFGRCFPS